MPLVTLSRRAKVPLLLCSAGVLLVVAAKMFTGQSLMFTADHRTGFVLALLFAEQLSNGASNVMNLQCWAGSVHLEVVEPRVRDLRGLGDQVFHFTSDYQNDKRFSDLIDVDQWNKYGSDRHYTPLTPVETFLEKASRNIILVQVMYGTVLCPSEPVSSTVFNPWYSVNRLVTEVRYTMPLMSLLGSHGFKTVRRVCINSLQDGRLRTQREFDDLVFGDLRDKGNFTVVFKEWRAIRNESEREGKVDLIKTSEWHRIAIKDSLCHYFCTDHGRYSITKLQPDPKTTPVIYPSAVRSQNILSLVPSAHILTNTAKYWEQHMSGKPYIAIMMRMENLQFGIGTEEAYTECLSSVLKLWKYATTSYQIDQTFLTSDIGQYGSYSWSPSGAPLQYQQDILKAVGLPPSFTLTRDNDLETIINSKGRVEMGWTQSIITAQARCIILLGAGSYQGLILNIHNALYRGTECFVMVDNLCKVIDQNGFQ